MPAKVILKVTKGTLAGKEYIYDGKEHLIIGRQDDCTIVLPEKTVSRYHCMLEITPPQVMVRDFGSLNGTFLNGEKIGQRDKDTSIEEAQKEYHEEFPLRDGDTLGLSKSCELVMYAYVPKYCAECGEELPEDEALHCPTEDGSVTCKSCFKKNQKKKEEAEAHRIADEKAEQERLKAERKAAKLLEHQRQEAERKRKEAEERAVELARQIKEINNKAAREEAERKRREAEKKAAELKAAEEEQKLKLQEQKKAEEELRRKEAEQKQKEEKQRALQGAKAKQAKCDNCGVYFTLASEDDTICPRCKQNPAAVLDALLKKLILEAEQGAMQVKNMAPSPVKGYRKVKLLGQGGMGEVWLVQEEKTGRKMALKTMLPKVAADKNAKNLFLRESLLGKYLDHENVVKVFKTGCANGVFYILMEFCEGGSVDDLIKKHGGRLPLELATYIMIQVLGGLDYTHKADIKVKLGFWSRDAKGVVHRDFKPGNIFLSDDSEHPVAKVADFGLAKAFETAGLSGNTRTGNIAGTPVFMPRQQIINYKYAKPDVDVWAAAASYYFMLTGTIPKEFKGGDIWMAMLNGRAIPIQRRNPRIPQELAAVIDRALVESPAIGISTAAEFKRQLVAALPEDVKAAVKGVI